jgi:hypothetical protein
VEGLHCADRHTSPQEGQSMVSIQNIWKTTRQNLGKVMAVVVVLLLSIGVYAYLNNSSDLSKKSQAIAINLSKRIGVPYPEAYSMVRDTLKESENLPENGGFFERIWYGSPRTRYLENTIETRLRRSGFYGFWLGSEVRAAVRTGLREAATPQKK